MLLNRTRLDQTHLEMDTEVPPPLLIAGSALALLLFMAWLHPSPLVLPVLSIILVVSGFVVGGISMLRHRGSPLGNHMLLSALIVFAGFAAAMMGDPDVAVQYLRHLP